MAIQLPPADPRKTALDKLHSLKQNYVDLSAHEVAQQTVDGLRLVISQNFGPKSLNLTPDEFFTDYQEKIMEFFSHEDKESLVSILNVCDRLRFAPDKDDPSERLPLIEKTIQFMRELPEKPESLANNAGPSAS